MPFMTQEQKDMKEMEKTKKKNQDENQARIG